MISRRLSLAATAQIAWTAIAPLGFADEEAAEIARRVDAYLAPYDAAGHLSGSLLVAVDEDIVVERSFGLASRQTERKNDADTRFCIASITKPMTAAIALRLFEQGKFGAADKLERFLPDFPRSDEITVVHLLNHRAGIPHRVTEDDDVRRTAADMVALAAKKPLLFEPGSQHSYSSGGFSVLARVLEVAGEASFSELLRTHVFEPAGMDRTIDSIDLGDQEHARAFNWTPTRLIATPENDLSFLVGAGSIWSTTRDLFLLQRAILAGELGPTVRQNTVKDEGLDWNGITGGFRAFADFHRRTGVTIIWLSNVQTGAAERIREELQWIVDGDEPEEVEVPTCAPVTLADDVLARYTGQYEMRPGSNLDVRPEHGALRVGDYLLVPTSETTFFSPQDYAMVTVVLDDAGKPIRLDWDIDGDVSQFRALAD